MDHHKLMMQTGGFGPTAFANFLGANALPSFLALSRAGGAMMFDSTGALVWAPENHVIQSSNFDNVAWAKSAGGVGSAPVITPNAGVAPDGSLTADRAVFALNGGATATDRSDLSMSTGALIGTAINSFYVKSFDGVSSYNILILSPTAGQLLVAVTSSWTRVNVSGSNGSGLIGLRLRGTVGTSNSADILVWGAQEEGVTYQTTPSAYNPTTSAAYYGPRFDYTPVTLIPLGLLAESAGTNAVLQCRDMTNVAWTKTNATAVKDQTGIDGVASSASRITASAANGTVLQAITLASSARFQSAYVKRLVGAGVINMTMDNGATLTAITVTAAWTRVTIPTQTLANPTVGFQIVTNGDSIAVDFVQNETGTFATSPIWTAAAVVTRATDVLSAGGLTSNPAIIQYRDEATGVRARKVINPWSVVSAETYEWIEQAAIYPVGTTATYLNAHLVVDGPY